MKKTAYLIVSGLLLTASCSEEFLDQDINARREITAFYNTPEQIYSALLDAYSALQSDGLTNARWVIGDLASDDALKGGESAGDAPEFQQIVEGRPLATNGAIRDLWVGSFTGIARANIVLTKIDEANFGEDESLKEQYRAEAKFLRAFNYYYVAMAFGDAPLITEGVTDFSEVDFKSLSKKPVSEIWALVESDLTEAIPNLATRSVLGTANNGRATRGAAQALLGKALMFQRKYPEAVNVLKPVVESSEYSLESDYGRLFRSEGEFSKENIFEINFINSSTGWGDDCEGSPRVSYQLSRGDGGYGFNQPTQDLVDEFEPGDPRLIYTINWPNDEFEGGVKQQNSQYNPYGYSDRKIFKIKSERSPNGFCDGKNETIFRLADMYLLYAEAAMKSATPNPGEALKYLNLVRDRANTTPKRDPQRVVQQFTVASTTLPQRVYTGDAQLLQDIYHERRVELAMEGIRWWDLVRQGRTSLLTDYYQEWSVSKGNASKGDVKGQYFMQWMSMLGRTEYAVYPVPQSEVDASQGNLAQTPGY